MFLGCCGFLFGGVFGVGEFGVYVKSVVVIRYVFVVIEIWWIGWGSRE